MLMCLLCYIACGALALLLFIKRLTGVGCSCMHCVQDVYTNVDIVCLLAVGERTRTVCQQHMAMIYQMFLQSQVARVQVEIDIITAELAASATTVAAATETLAAAAVHHPELHWEQAASALLPKLSAAKDLFDKDKHLRDFK